MLDTALNAPLAGMGNPETHGPRPRERRSERLGLYRALSVGPIRKSFVAKIMLVCFLGIHVPLIALIGYVLATGTAIQGSMLTVLVIALVATLAGTAATLAVLYLLLAPVRLAARGLRDYLQHGMRPALPVGYQDEVGQLLHDTQSAVTQLDATLSAAQAERDQAQASNAAKAGFVARMSHEMKTPLNAVIGFSEMMQAEMFGPVGNDRYREYVTEIHEAGDRLLALVSDTISLSRGELGHYSLNDTVFDVGESIGDATSMMSILAHNAGVSLTTNLAHRPMGLRADRRALHQMLVNLISNAIKFTPDGGDVTVRSKCENGFMQIAVADTGCGIPEADLDRIMLPFTNASEGQELANRRQEGSGLGLSIVSMMMSAHGGRIEVESMLGHGTTFTLIFPIERTVRPGL